MIAFVVAFIVGAVFARYQSERARKVMRVGAACLGVHWACLVVTGVFRLTSPAMFSHRWAAHALVNALWWIVPFGIGAICSHRFATRPIVSAMQVIAGVILLCAGFLASFTGYLGPSFPENLREETALRFRTLHLVFLPAVGGALILNWWHFFRPRKFSSASNSPS